MAAYQAAALPHAKDAPSPKAAAFDLYPDLDAESEYGLQEKWWETPDAES